MVSKLVYRLGSRLLRNTKANPTILSRSGAGGGQTPLILNIIESPPLISPSLLNHYRTITGTAQSSLRHFSTSARRMPAKSSKIDIGARARQMQTRRLWTYALTFSGIAVFVVIVLNNFQDQLVFYVTPTEGLEKFKTDPSKTKFRLGGLVLEGSVAQPAKSPEVEFVITDLITDMLVRFQGSLPDLFREGHSVVVEGFMKPFTDELRNEVSSKSVSGKARSGECYFSATEVLAKHDEKYMPAEVAAAIEKNKKLLAAKAIEDAKEAAAQVDRKPRARNSTGLETPLRWVF